MQQRATPTRLKLIKMAKFPKKNIQGFSLSPINYNYNNNNKIEMKCVIN